MSLNFFKVIKNIAISFNLKAFKLRGGVCPLCGKTIFIRYNFDKWSVRCVKCGAASNSMALVNVLKNNVKCWTQKKVYITSANGPYYNYIQQNCRFLTNSLFIENVPSGEYYNNVLCQDLQKLSFEDCVFDICTSAEVFEHIPNDRDAFKEIYRILKPGGYHIFTVPLSNENITIERAVLVDGKINYLKDPEYHNDSIRGGKVLCYRDYGKDILEKLSSVGFRNFKIITPADPTGIGYENPVIISQK